VLRTSKSPTANGALPATAFTYRSGPLLTSTGPALRVCSAYVHGQKLKFDCGPSATSTVQVPVRGMGMRGAISALPPTR
jgi:hypothetical protein